MHNLCTQKQQNKRNKKSILLNSILNFIKFATQHPQELEKHQFFSDAIMYLTHILHEYEQQQESIIGILSDSNKNVI